MDDRLLVVQMNGMDPMMGGQAGGSAAMGGMMTPKSESFTMEGSPMVGGGGYQGAVGTRAVADGREFGCTCVCKYLTSALPLSSALQYASKSVPFISSQWICARFVLVTC